MIYHFKMRWNAEVDVTDGDGRTALHWAAYKGFPDPVKLLVCMDADVYRADKEGCTALHWAAIKGRSEAAHLIVQAGGLNALTAVDVDGNTPEALAIEKGNHSLAQFFHSQYRRLLNRDKFWQQKGLAVACFSLVVGLMLMFTHYVMFAPSTATMDVNLAFWSLVVLASSGGGLVYMKRVTTADPGFVTASLLSSLRRGSRASSAAKEVDERLNHPSCGEATGTSSACRVNSSSPSAPSTARCEINVSRGSIITVLGWVTRSESAITEISSSFSVSRRLPWRWRSSSPSFA